MHFINSYDDYVDIFRHELACEDILGVEDFNLELKNNMPISYPCILYLKIEPFAPPGNFHIAYIYKEEILDWLSKSE